MNIWKKNDWQTWKGVWLVVADISDEEMILLLLSNPAKYGDVYLDWFKEA